MPLPYVGSAEPRCPTVEDILPAAASASLAGTSGKLSGELCSCLLVYHVDLLLCPIWLPCPGRSQFLLIHLWIQETPFILLHFSHTVHSTYSKTFSDAIQAFCPFGERKMTFVLIAFPPAQILNSYWYLFASISLEISSLSRENFLSKTNTLIYYLTKAIGIYALVWKNNLPPCSYVYEQRKAPNLAKRTPHPPQSSQHVAATSWRAQAFATTCG